MEPSRCRTPSLVLALGTAFASGAAAAQGAYVGAGGGVNFARDQDLRGSDVTYDDGAIATIAVGYAFRNGLRPEVEYAYRDNNAETAGEATQGATDAEAVMANLWYDLPSPAFARALDPYIGIGFGAAEIGMNQVTDGTGRVRSDTEQVAGGQVGAGLGYAVTRRLAVNAGYRYFLADEARFDPGALDAEYGAHSVMAGLRYTFGGREPKLASAETATPAPVATAPREQAEIAAFETVVLRPVNFQFDEAQLTEPARAILDELAARLAAEPELHVLIEGHTDTVGDPQYNESLGQRRAQAVRDYLVERGVNRSNLRLSSQGESEPKVTETSTEARATNRRAEMWPLAQPADVKIRIEAPTEDSVEAAEQPAQGAPERGAADTGAQD